MCSFHLRPLGFLHIPLPYIDLLLTTLHFHFVSLKTIQFSFCLFLNRLTLFHFYFPFISFCSLFPFLSYSVFRTLPVLLPKFTSSTSLSFYFLFPTRRYLIPFLSFLLPASIFLLFIYLNKYPYGFLDMSHLTMLLILFRSTSFTISNFVYKHFLYHPIKFPLPFHTFSKLHSCILHLTKNGNNEYHMWPVRG